MNDNVPTPSFYQSIEPIQDFAALSDGGSYVELPDYWLIGTSDIVGSTRAVADGLYKRVNMVAASVISAQINAHKGAAFPFIFGGDGAAFAVPPDWHARAADALAAVQVFAAEEFSMDLRIGMVSVAQIRAAGHDVRVARFTPSVGVDYAMFSGGGVSWAEDMMKSGAHDLPRAGPGTRPDLTGLSCRWSHMPSQKGRILSILIMPQPNVRWGDFSEAVREVVDLSRALDRDGTPVPQVGPGVNWPPAGATLEGHAQKGAGSLGAARRKALIESFIAWALIKTGISLGGFDARRYRDVVGRNADFRKFDDGLKMTLDCDPMTEARLRTVLDAGEAAGLLRYGIHAQDQAMMTCIVPSIMTDDHVHFVDGAAGGYTAAAMQIKSQPG